MSTIDEQQREGNGASVDQELELDNDRVDDDIEQPQQLPVEPEQSSRKLFSRIPERFLIRVVVIFGHACFVAFSVLANFIYKWSNDSEGAVWLSLTNEGVFEHLKTMLWPWLLTLFPMDLLARVFVFRNEEGSEQRTWYLRCVSQSSWRGLCMATPVSMLSAMLFISIVFTILLYSGSKLLAVDVTVYMIAIVAGAILRISLMKRKDGVTWAAFAYLLGGMIWFFTYFSYSDDAYEGFWLNPDPYNHTLDSE